MARDGNFPPANQPPVARISASPLSGQAPLAVAFSGSASSDSDGTIASYAWSFGDGASATGVTASHAYNVAGTYTAKLTVTDNQGATGSATISIIVSAAPPPVIKACFIQRIDMALAIAKGGTSANARVFVVDETGVVVKGATVSGAWSGLVSGSASGLTGADGSVILKSPKTKKHGMFVFTITGVTVPAGYKYEAGRNLENSDSISN